MSRHEYIDSDVLTEAKARLHHIFDTHDSVVVCFSGGKDSLVALHLAYEVAKERGLDGVDAIFRDEELIPDSVIDFVDEYRQKDWCRLLWFAIPLASSKFILGQNFDYVQWDPDRQHVREIPEWAITLEPGDTRVFDQYTTDAYIAGYYKGKVALITGVRAAESLMRYRASVNKINENYINATKSRNASLCKPLYDWQENDVLKYFYENDIKYCNLYNAQHLSGSSLRVSTPLHAESAKKLGAWRAQDPEFYDRILQVFPEVQVQELYWKELDRKGLKAKWGESYETILTYINTQIDDPKQRRAARAAYKAVMKRVPRGGYEPGYVFTYIYGGVYKRELLPQTRKAK